MIRALLDVAWSVLVVVTVVPVRRLREGPTRPGWSLRHELVAAVMQRLARLTMVHPLPILRSLWNLGSRFLLVRGPVTRAACPSVPCTWFGREDAKNVVLYLHGGAYVLGSVVAYRDACSRLARAGAARVLAVDYRLAPEHPYPAALEDAWSAYRWLTEDEGVPPHTITLAGDSAGGGLSLALLIRLREAGVALPARVGLISPWADVEGGGASQLTNAAYDYVPQGAQPLFGSMYAGKQPLDHPLVSPVHADLSGLPPMLVMVGGAERLLDTGRQVAERARACGVDVVLEVYDDMIHAWPLLALVLPEGRRAWRRLGEWLGRDRD